MKSNNKALTLKKSRRILEWPLKMFWCMFPGLQPAARNSVSPPGLENNASETSSKEPTKCFRRSKVKNNTKQKLLRTEGERTRGRSSYSYCYFLTANLVKIPCFETTHMEGKETRLMKMFCCRTANKTTVCPRNRVTQPYPCEWLCLGTPSTWSASSSWKKLLEWSLSSRVGQTLLITSLLLLWS